MPSNKQTKARITKGQAERGRHQAAERNEGQGYAEGFRSFRLLGVPVSDHGKAASVGKSRSDSLQASCEEEQAVRLANGEEQGGEEHDSQAEHHGQIITDPVDDSSGKWSDEDLNGGLRGEQETDSRVLTLVLDQYSAHVDFLRLIDVRDGVVSGGVAETRKVLEILIFLDDILDHEIFIQA